jgi:hypothetical protein
MTRAATRTTRAAAPKAIAELAEGRKKVEAADAVARELRRRSAGRSRVGISVHCLRCQRLLPYRKGTCTGCIPKDPKALPICLVSVGTTAPLAGGNVDLNTGELLTPAVAEAPSPKPEALPRGAA